ncbi:unnamed protein product [Enterobius vermicularis]|uniref:BMA-DSH-1 n=1 Tax=Enterobius vermicularis TaxID=51028 RepID=A0A0N4VIM0_ENTVE|nr:unnamed protein product [Enterobius vermicularis]
MTEEFLVNSASSSSHCDNENSQSRSESPLSESSDDEGQELFERHINDGALPCTSEQLTTKIYYHIDAEAIPYCAIIDVSPDEVTLKDFKRVFSKSNFKYFCKVPSPDSEISKEVKVEISKDSDMLLRSARGQYELYLESYDENGYSDASPDFTLGPSETSGVTNNMKTNRGRYRRYISNTDQTGTSYETDSYAVGSYRSFRSLKRGRSRRYNWYNPEGAQGGHRGFGGRDSAIGSDTEVQLNSEDEERVSTSTDFTSVSRQKPNNYRKRCSRKKFRQASQSSFYTSILENSMSMDVLTVTLNLDIINYLGISIVGQSSLKGDNGIYVANVIKVALDGRIEPGDMIIQVNDIALDNFTNDQAVDFLKELVTKRGLASGVSNYRLIKLTVAKMWDGRPRSDVSIPRYDTEPVRPIDLNAWIQHTNAMRGLVSAAGKLKFQRGSKFDRLNIVRALALPDSGLKLKDHTWLKMQIPNSFLGADLIDWMMEHIEGFTDRKQARFFANELLNEKLITHFTSVNHFTEKRYYTFGSLIGNGFLASNVGSTTGTESVNSPDKLVPMGILPAA